MISGIQVEIQGFFSKNRRLNSYGFFSPFKKLQKHVDDNTRHIETDNTRIKSLEHDRSIIFRALFALIDHALTGNSTGELKKAHNELREMLTEKR